MRQKSDDDIIKERISSRLYAEEQAKLVAERAAQQDTSRQQFNALLQAQQASEAQEITRLRRVKELRGQQAALLSELGALLEKVWAAQTEAEKIEDEVYKRVWPYLLTLSDPRRGPYWDGLLARAGLRPLTDTFRELPAQTPVAKLARMVLRAIACRVLTPAGIVAPLE